MGNFCIKNLGSSDIQNYPTNVHPQPQRRKNVRTALRREQAALPPYSDQARHEVPNTTAATSTATMRL